MCVGVWVWAWAWVWAPGRFCVNARAREFCTCANSCSPCVGLWRRASCTAIEGAVFRADG
jgi:hypothetical protein